jgi:DNA-binding transcriptional ArsR family regulator
MSRAGLYQSVARLAQAFSNGNRLRLLELVSQAERSVDDLARQSGLTLANASQHLQALRQAGLVTARKDGVRVFYAVAGNDVIKLYKGIRVVAASRLPEMVKRARTVMASGKSLSKGKTGRVGSSSRRSKSRTVTA